MLAATSPEAADVVVALYAEDGPLHQPDEEPAEPEAEEAWAEPDTDWPHEWIEFCGDRLAVRKPTQHALAAYSMSASKFVAVETQNNISGGFMYRHMSPASYDRVMDRFTDPDDPDYGEDSLGDLMQMIVKLRTDEMPEPANRAARRHPDA